MLQKGNLVKEPLENYEENVDHRKWFSKDREGGATTQEPLKVHDPLTPSIGASILRSTAMSG